MSRLPDEMPDGSRVRDWPCLIQLAALSTEIDALRCSGLRTEDAVARAAHRFGVTPDHWAVDAALAIGLSLYRLAPDLFVGPRMFLEYASLSTMNRLGPRLLLLARQEASLTPH